MNTKLNFSLLILSALFLVLISSSSFAQNEGGKKHGAGFVDLNGDGYNDNAPDHDNDGIPNGQDPDYKGPKSFGPKNGYARGFIDENGDGINDRAYDSDGDGIPNGRDDDYIRPLNGAGRKLGNAFGLKGNGHGNGRGECDGTGPKGKGGGRGK